MKSLQERVFNILEVKDQSSMSNTDVVNLGKSVREVAREFGITASEAEDALQKISRLTSFEVGGVRYYFKTENSLPLYAKDFQQTPRLGVPAPAAPTSTPEAPRLPAELPRSRSPRGRNVILEVLNLLDQKPISVSKLCEKLGLDYHRNVTSSLKALRESGFIERVEMDRCPTCGRRLAGAMYGLTELGKASLAKLKEAAPL